MCGKYLFAGNENTRIPAYNITSYVFNIYDNLVIYTLRIETIPISSAFMRSHSLDGE